MQVLEHQLETSWTGLVYIPEQKKTVYYASNGQMQYGWQTINNKKHYFDTYNGAMKTGTVNINGKNYTFNSDGTLKQDTWGWPFPSVGQGSFTGAQLFGVNPGGEFRANGFHDGLERCRLVMRMVLFGNIKVIRC